MNDKILIFIPMYCCEKQIPRVLARIAALGEKQELFSGVLVVDNGSSDASIAAASKAINDLSIPGWVIKNRENYSLGGSHKVAFLYALQHGYSHVVVLHGDDQGDIFDVLPFIETGKHRCADSLLGSRFMQGSRLVGYSSFRIFGNHVFNAVVSALSGRTICDLGSGVNIYKVDYLKSKFYLPFPNNLTFNVYLLLYGIYTKSQFVFFPISWREDDQVSNAKLFAQSRQILGLALHFALGRKKLFQKLAACPVQTYEYDVMACNREAASHA